MTPATAIVGGLVFDGTGAEGRVQDIYLAGDRITAVSPPAAITGDPHVIDAAGLVIAPGFIDVHSHADSAPFLPEHDTSKILQGVTTEVVGNCGISLAPRHDFTAGALAAYVGRVFPAVPWAWHTTAEFLAEVDRANCVTNYAPLAGHGTIRIAVMGMASREPTDAEMTRMKSLLQQSMDAGCFGLSTGLVYPPGMHAASAELEELARALPPDRIYTSHIRGEGDDAMAAVQEAIHLSESAGRRVQVSHLKAAGRGNWGRSADLLRLLDAGQGPRRRHQSGRIPVHGGEHHARDAAAPRSRRRRRRGDPGSDGSGGCQPAHGGLCPRGPRLAEPGGGLRVGRDTRVGHRRPPLRGPDHCRASEHDGNGPGPGPGQGPRRRSGYARA